MFALGSQILFRFPYLNLSEHLQHFLQAFVFRIFNHMSGKTSSIGMNICLEN